MRTDPLFFEAPEELQIDLLMDVHVLTVVGAQDIIDDFEVERRVAVPFEVSTNASAAPMLTPSKLRPRNPLS